MGDVERSSGYRTKRPKRWCDRRKGSIAAYFTFRGMSKGPPGIEQSGEKDGMMLVDARTRKGRENNILRMSKGPSGIERGTWGKGGEGGKNNLYRKSHTV